MHFKITRAPAYAFSVVTSSACCCAPVWTLLQLSPGRCRPQGLLPYYISPRDGGLLNNAITFGAMGDSYYEYLLKVRRHLQLSCTTVGPHPCHLYVTPLLVCRNQVAYSRLEWGCRGPGLSLSRHIHVANFHPPLKTGFAFMAAGVAAEGVLR